MKKLIWLFFIMTIKSADAQILSREIDIKPNWEYVTSSVNKDSWYINKNILNLDDGQIKVWTKIEFNTTSFRGKEYKKAYELRLINFDCKNKKVQILVNVLYDSKGKLIDSYTHNSPTSDFIIPDTSLDIVSKRICNL